MTDVSAMGIHDAIAELTDALRSVGLDGPQPPLSRTAVDELAAAVAPLKLPPELIDFWTAVDVATLRVEPFPHWTGPEWALRSWASGIAESPDVFPRSLLQIGYQSHVDLVIELDDPDAGPGGRIFEHAYDGEAYCLWWESLTDQLEWVAGELRSGAFTLSTDDPVAPNCVAFLDAEWPRTGDRSPYGGGVEIADNALHWPAHWQRASGIDPDDARPRGTTMSIAELLATEPDGEMRCTIRGEVINAMGAVGCVITLSDGTGEVTIDCPPRSTTFGVHMGGQWEIDVVVRAGAQNQLPDPPILGEQNDALFAAGARALGDPHAVAAVTAETVRPLAD